MKALEILVEELDGGLWVAAVTENVLQGLEIDPANEEVRWGSIYWGRVTRIDKAIDAAFVDLDGDNTGILNNADVRIISKAGKVTKGGTKEIGKLLSAGDMIAVQAKNGYIPKDDDDDLPLEKKCPRVSMDITLPGRYLVYAPLTEENQISARIRDKKLRKQLLKMLNSIEIIKGCILRAAAANMQTDILRRESIILKTIWDQLQEHLAGEEPGLIMLGPDSLQRILGDQAEKLVDRIEIVTMEQFAHVEEWCEIFAPDLVTKIKPIELADAQTELSLFYYRDIMEQIDSLFKPYNVLKDGASIIIQATAAVTAIDINRGNDKRSHLEINIDAAGEVGRQLKLRNIGGAVMIDFLKMKNKKEQTKLLAALEDAFEGDPCTVQIHGITNLGMAEITRKRRTPPLQDRFDGILE